jgi:tetratricopeptide (TPR) repeat protein
MSPFLISVLLILVGAIAVALGLRAVQRRKVVLVERVDEALADGEYHVAAERALAALASRPDPGIASDLRCRLARASVGIEEYVAAERSCRDAVESAPGPRERAAALVELGRCLAVSGDFDAALAAIEQTRAMQVSAELRDARELVAADIALTRLRFDDAERALAVVYRPSAERGRAAEAAVAHARLQYLKGNFHQAIAEINRVLERLTENDLQVQALVTLARALLDQERPAPVEADQAISSAQLLVRYPGLAAMVVACEALVQAHFGNEKEALEAAARAPRLTISKRFLAETHCLVGDALRRLGRISEARMHYQTALGIDAGWLEALWGLGKCAEAAGLREVAGSYFQLCIEAAPEHFIAQRSEEAQG